MRKKWLLMLVAVLATLTFVCVGCDEPAPTPPQTVTVYTVTVEGEPQRVIEGQSAVLTTPTRDGFTFAGWTANGAEYLPGTPVTQDLTIHAVWVEDEAEPEPITAELSVTSVGTATSVWTAEYGVDGITFFVEVTDGVIVTDNANIGYNDNIELVLTAVPTHKYDTRYTYDFLCDANGSFWFKRANGAGSFGDNCAYDLFVKLGENLRYTVRQVEGGWTAEIYFAYELLNTDYKRAFGNVRFIPSMRNTDYGSTIFDWYARHGSTWGKPSSFLQIAEDNTLRVAHTAPVDVNEAFEATSLYDGRRLTDNLASISDAEGGSRVCELHVGANIFFDRFYGLDKNAVCDDLLGKSFLYDSIEGPYGKVTKAGYVILLAPENNYASLNYRLQKDGWLKFASDERNLFSIPPGNGAIVETFSYYVKWCEVGTVIHYEKYFIPIFETADEFWVDVSYDTPCEIRTDFTGFELFRRHWQGVTTMERTKGGRLFASWVSGGDNEPRCGSHNVVVYSDDNGATWNDLWIITHPHPNVKINDAQLWIDPDGQLWCFYVQSHVADKIDLVTEGGGFDKHSGVWVVKVADPDADVITHTEPEREFDGLLRNQPIVLSDGTWLAFPNDYVDETNSIVYASTDKGETWTVRGGAYIPQAYNFDETVIYEMLDGTLRMMVRTAVGTIYESRSTDKGYTWSEARSTGIANPCSRFQVFRMPSGNIMMINNDSATGRDKMSVYLSEDDGESWKYVMLMDASTSTSYPDYSIDYETGEVWFVWDWSRVVQGNIRMTHLTEQDVIDACTMWDSSNQRFTGIYDQSRIITVSKTDYANTGATEGVNYGSANGLVATGGFNMDNDRGENPSIWQAGTNAQYAFMKVEPSADVYYETDILAGSVVNRDGYPKYGITVTSGTHHLFFYVDAQNWMQNHTVGVVTRTLSTDWSWSSAVTVPASIDYASANTLGILKQGSMLRFFLNGNCVMDLENVTGFGASDKVTPGILTFNFRAFYSNYSASTDTATLTAKRDHVNAVGTLFVGHSFLSLRTYHNFFKHFPDAVNVAVYGSETNYWLNNFDELIARYNPSRIVLSIGENDLNRGDSVDKTYSEVIELVDRLHATFPDAQIYWHSWLASLRWWHLEPQLWELRNRTDDYAEGKEWLTLVKSYDEFVFTSDRDFVRGDLFCDRLHFNDAGYELFAKALKKAMGYEEMNV